MISSNALSVTVPRRSVPGEVYITVYVDGEHYCTDSPGVYKYLGKTRSNYNNNKLLALYCVAMDGPSMDDAIEKLGDLLNVSSKVSNKLLCLDVM